MCFISYIYCTILLEFTQYILHDLEIMEIVPLNDHLNEFKRHDERKNKTCNRNYDRLRKTPNHPVNAAVPSRRRLSDLCRYVPDLFVDRVKQPRKIIRYSRD